MRVPAMPVQSSAIPTDTLRLSHTHELSHSATETAGACAQILIEEGDAEVGVGVEANRHAQGLRGVLCDLASLSVRAACRDDVLTNLFPLRQIGNQVHSSLANAAKFD
jgi:hypothetical protein